GGLPGVSGVEIRGDRARLRTQDPDATVTALAGLGALRRVEVTAPSLEDAFLALTGEAATEVPSAPVSVSASGSASASAFEEKAR
ncbi:ABC transporter ATP-binding protein, partial [Streptomyces sp. NPDC059656]